MKNSALNPFYLGSDLLDTNKLVQLASNKNPSIAIKQEDLERLEKYRAHVEQNINDNNTVYGINTGFGFLANVRIEEKDLVQLQLNLIRSHACGVGEYVSEKIVRACLILRAHTFLLANSGVSYEVVNQILQFLKYDILPMIPAQGSVGASGDLAPLAHLALALIGEGEVRLDGNIIPAKTALRKFNLKALMPKAKEGLSLINGTHFMTVIAAFTCEESYKLLQSADIISAMSLDCIKGTLSAFDPRVQKIRPHYGQEKVAQNIHSLFNSNSEIMNSHKDCDKVQDPYSFRCIPQVHGACRDTYDHVVKTVNCELNSVTDNPLIFENGEIISAGNFHGQPLAFVMDFLAIAMAEIASISERRIEKLTNPNLSGLPAFVTKKSGLNSGYMIPHVVAASLVSENKVLAHPASVDSIPTSADKEDHVSMGPIAARKAKSIVKNTSNVLAIELLAACQALDLLSPLKTSQALDSVFKAVRKQAPMMETDLSLHKEILQVAQWLLNDSENLVTIVKKQNIIIL